MFFIRLQNSLSQTRDSWRGDKTELLVIKNPLKVVFTLFFLLVQIDRLIF